RGYCFAPTFRAEKTNTHRHLTEFWMIEPEVAFADLDDDMALAEDFLVEVVGRVIAERKAEFATLERDLAPLERVQKPFPRIRYEEALGLLAADGKTLAFGDDF